MIAVLWWFGCGQDICSRREISDTVCGELHSSEETKACRDDLNACRGKDQRLLEDYSKCYEEAGAYECDPTDAQRIAALDCLVFLDDLSEDCVIPIGAL